MSGIEPNIKVTSREVAAEPVLCDGQLAYLSYKAEQLQQALGAGGGKIPVDNDMVAVRFQDDGSTRLEQLAVAGRNDQTAYIIEPGVRFAVEVYDESGGMAESWSCRPGDMLAPDEAANMAYPLHMMLRMLSQQNADG